MTFTISHAQYSLLCQKNYQPDKYNLVLDDDESLFNHPASLGQHGYSRFLELSPGIYLEIFNRRSDCDLVIKTPAHDHSIEIMMLNSGYLPIDNYPTIGGKQTFLSGSGVVPDSLLKLPHGENFSGIHIHIELDVFSSFFPNLALNSDFGKRMIKQDDWAEILFPKVTPSIWALVRQIMNTPYRGTIRKLYLQGKMLELLAIQLDPIIAECDRLPARTSLKPKSIDRIYQALDILVTQLENPPSVMELAQQVGVSERTLRRGFRELFNTTVVGYLTSLRMERAELFLREGKLSIGEVANLMGYSNLSHFSTAFKRQFGITPSQCMTGQKPLST